MRLRIKKKTNFLFHCYSLGECSPFTNKCCLTVRYSISIMRMYLLIHISAWFFISALSIFTMWYVLSTVREINSKEQVFPVTCMQNGSPSACLSETQPPLEPPVAPHSLQGVGRGPWDPACLSLLFPVKASPVSQKLPSTC